MSRYGLDSCVFTNDYRRVWRIARDLQVGGLTVNDHPKHGVGYFPFGGSKASGIGREGIGYSVDEMTELKTIVFNLEA
jgi:glyceraldehyde-3-phosphate dehydrogenase [NAD(P)+]